MSRIARYRESIHKFIVDKGQLKDCSLIDGTDQILPIMLLTVMNNQNKKNQTKKQLQGYYAAAAICFLTLSFFTKDLEKKRTFDSIAFTSITSNIESINNYLDPADTIRITLNVMNRMSKIMNDNIKLNELVVKTNGPICDEVMKWYSKQAKTTNRIHPDSYQELMQYGLLSLCETSFVLGWLLGCGPEKDIALIETVAREFGQMYKMSNDFKTLDSDLLEDKTLNFVINYGIQSAYNNFIKSKERFIELCVGLDMYTITIKEIVSELESHIDKIMENMSVDTKSLFTESQSEH